MRTSGPAAPCRRWSTTPHQLDVARVHGPVSVLEVGPVAHPLRHVQPRADVPQHRLAAPLVEAFNPVRLNIPLAGQAEFLLHRDLDRQSVAVPASPARNLESLHGLEPGKQVLERPRLDVVCARQPVSRRRSLIESPGRAARRLCQRPLERPRRLPAGEDLVLYRGQVDLRGKGRESRHRPRVSSAHGRGCA